MALAGADLAEPLALLDHQAVDQVDLAVAPLVDVLQDAVARAAAADVARQLVEQLFQRPIGAADVFGLEPENRLDAVAQVLADVERLLTDAQEQLAHARQPDRISHAQPDDGEWPEAHRVDDELHPLGGEDVGGDRDLSDVAQELFDLGHPSVHGRIEAAEPEPGLLRRCIALHDTGREQFRRQLDHAADGARRPHHFGDQLGGHGVLQADEQPVGREVRLDEFAGPARVVGFHRQQHDVERLVQRAHVAQVIGAHRHVQLAVGHVDAQPVRAHRLDVLRPLIDEDDVATGLGEIGCGAAAVGAGAEHCDFLAHPCFLASIRMARIV